MAKLSKSSRFTVCLALGTLMLGAFGFGPANAAPTEDFPVVKLRSLDKVTARTMTFEAKVGSTVQFGPLYIKVQACRKAPPIEKPEAASFLQIWEIGADEKAEWVFSGWMFASSPALSPMDHPIYDVWVIDCLNEQAPGKEKDELPEESVVAKPEGEPETAPADDASNSDEIESEPLD